MGSWTLSKAERTFFKFPKIAFPVLSLHLLPGKFSRFLPRSSSAIRCYLGMAATSSSTATDAEALRRDRILSSKLYLDVPPSKVFPHLSNKQTNKQTISFISSESLSRVPIPQVPVIYSTSYDISFLGIEKL